MGQLTFAFLLYVMCLWISMQTVNGTVCYAYSTLLNHRYSFYCEEVCCDSHSPGLCCKSVNRRSFHVHGHHHNYHSDDLSSLVDVATELSDGEIAGIVIGCIFGLVLLLSLVALCCAKCEGQNTIHPANQQTIRNAATQPHTITAGQPPPYNLNTVMTVRGLEQLSAMGGRVPETLSLNSGVFPEQPQATDENVPEQQMVTELQLPADDDFDSTVP